MEFSEKKPLIIAHRGASGFAPENTFAAFQRAIEVGAEGVEFDVQLSKDSVPMVIHDFDLKRLAGIDQIVSGMTANELQKLDVGSWFNKKYPQLARSEFEKQNIPTLVEFLEFFSGYQGLLYLELKCKKSEIKPLTKAVCDVIKTSKHFPRIIIKSFKLKAIAYAKVILPEVQTASLFAPKILNVINKRKHLLDKAEDCLADQISLHFSLATRKLVRRAKNRGLPTTIWTADNPLWIKRGIEIGLNAIITNDPEKLLNERTNVLQGNSIY